MTWLKNDTLFFSEREKGEAWEHFCFEELRKAGFYIARPPYRKDRNSPDRNVLSFTSQCDGAIWKHNKWEKIEIKSRNLEFTSHKDFPYEEIFVNQVRKAKQAEWTLIVSQKTKAIIGIDKECALQKGRETVSYDRVREIQVRNLSVKKKYFLDFQELCQAMKTQKA